MSRVGKLASGAAVVLLAGLAFGFVRWYLPTRNAVDIGAGMLAKQVCSCVYVAARDLADCRADQFPSMDPIRVEVLRDEGRVRAWIPALGERTAIHREGLGCVLE
jgi:hypothetical protein